MYRGDSKDGLHSSKDESSDLLPKLTRIAQLSRKIAFAVAKVAMEQNLALSVSENVLQQKVESNLWKAEYRPYKRASL